MIDKFLLGTDPELVLLDDAGLVSATKYYKQQVKGGVNPEIGGDGHPHIVELRPPPGKSPQELVKSIKDILTRHKDDVPATASWAAGTFVEDKPIGGHIHFGFKGGRDQIDELVTSMDGILAQMIILLEDTHEGKKRKAGNYGQLSDIRTKPWGFEYRSLPSWILSQEISTGVLALAKAIALEQLNEDPAALVFLKGSTLEAVTKVDPKKFRNSDKDYFRAKLPDLWKLIRRLQYFQTEEGKQCWRYVALLHHIASTYESWYNEKDILHRWKVRTFTPPAYTKRLGRKVVQVFQAEEVVAAAEGWKRILDSGQ